MASQALENVVSHWSTLLEGFQTSPLGFYQAIEAAAARRQVPNTANSRIDHKEAGVGSAKREYLRISREHLLFEICAAPFGTGFFVSWWLSEDTLQLNAIVKVLAVFGLVFTFGFFSLILTPFIGPFVFAGVLFGWLAYVNSQVAIGTMKDNFVRALPIIGTIYIWLFRPVTFYRIDSMEMFQKSIHNSVLEVIDAMTTEQGVRALAENERKPVMREFYALKRA